MKRTGYVCIAGGMVLIFAAARTSSQTEPPPRVDDEWKQEQWPSTPGQQRGPMTFDGPLTPGFGRGQADFQQRMADMQRRMAEMQRRAQESRNLAIRQALRATDQQWSQLKPRLERIERLKAEADVSIDPGSFGGGPTFVGGQTTFGGGWAGGFSGGGMASPGRNWSQSWSTGSPSTGKAPGERTRGDALCEELMGLLQGPSPSAAEVAGKVQALRRVREQARRQLAQERQSLRTLINPRQEAMLIVMGYLD